MSRLYRALLYLYPARFREEYGAELSRTFDETMRGRSRLAKLLSAFADAIPGALSVWWSIIRHGAGGGMALPTAGADVRFALRQIRRTPLFSGVVIGVIAIGIGTNAALLTTLNRYAWRPAPGIPSNDGLAGLTSTSLYHRAFPYAEIRAMRERRDLFDAVGGAADATLGVDFGAGPEATHSLFTTGNYFRTLRIPFAAGAGFPGADDRSDAPVVVIDHLIWATHFDSSTAVVGRTIRIANVQFTIVGVTPRHFTGTDALSMGRPTIWIPMGARSLIEPASQARVDSTLFRAFARLAPGIGFRDVAARGVAARAEALVGFPSSRSDRNEMLVAFFIVAAFVVLITCTNVSALLFGRAVARRREIGVRLALGATRRRLIRQMLTESLVYAVTGGLLGLALYSVLIKVAYATVPEVIYGMQPEPRTFMFAAAFALITTVVFGLAPALHATRADIGETIKTGGTHAIRRSRLQATFIVAQLACSQPVLVVTSMVIANTRGAEAPDLAAASVLRVDARLLHPLDDSLSQTLVASIRQRIGAQAGVQSVAMSSDAGEKKFEGASTASINQTFITPQYFAPGTIPILRGRGIGADEDRPGSVAVVVNEVAARRLWGDADPIGKRFVRRARDSSETTTTLEVIGVAGQASTDDFDAARVYAPMTTADAIWGGRIVVRTAGDARSFVPRLRAVLREVNPDLSIGNAVTVAESRAARDREAMLSNVAAFAVGAAALVLASLGLYAIIAFSIAQRGHEIGVRMAMGATPQDIVRYFSRIGVKISAIALAIGLPVTVVAIRLVQASVVGLTLRNVLGIAMVVPVLLAVAALASWLPARHAGRVDPLFALRSE
jgi:predicted permease